MTFSATPPTARTDVQAVPLAQRRGMSPGTIRMLGGGVAVGAAASAVSAAFVGFKPDTEAGILANDLSGLLFQIGLMGLLHVQMATRATGTKVINRRMLQLERVLLSLAMAWTLCHALLPSQRDSTWLAVLDFAWPLSMLGMFLIGVKIAVVGRWRGPARVWALVAETWVVVTIPALGVLGEAGGTVVGAVHLVLGYSALGILLATRPDLVEDRG